MVQFTLVYSNFSQTLRPVLSCCLVNRERYKIFCQTIVISSADPISNNSLFTIDVFMKKTKTWSRKITLALILILILIQT